MVEVEGQAIVEADGWVKLWVSAGVGEPGSEGVGWGSCWNWFVDGEEGYFFRPWTADEAVYPEENQGIADDVMDIV